MTKLPLLCMIIAKTALLLWLLSCPCTVKAKRVSGGFKLTGEKSEQVLTSFAVLPEGDAKVTVNLTTGATMYEDEQYLRFHLLRDVEWPKFLKALTCEDKVRVPHLHQKTVSFDYVNEQWRTPSPLSVVLNAPTKGESKEKPRPHYYYVVITDCSLETGYQRDQKIPLMHYELEFINILPKGKTTHLSADETQLTRLHMITMIISFCIVAYLGFNVLYHMSKAHTVHAAVLWVMIAAALDAGSSLFEIIHLNLYDSNGVGSYFADALAAHLEAICDAFLVLLLLSFAAGWTLPNDLVRVNPNESVVQKLVTDLAKPLASFSGAVVNAGSLFSLSIIALHVVLTQWGRTYNEEFESYHDFEHLPGRLLMGFRLLCGLLLVICTVQTRNKCKLQHLQAFYAKVAILGFAWFVSLPLLGWFCSWFVPYYLRHPTVFLGAALCQETSLLLFAWLVTAHSTSYHQISHVSAAGKNSHDGTSLTESAGPLGGSEESRTWKFGKAKVRLD